MTNDQKITKIKVQIRDLLNSLCTETDLDINMYEGINLIVTSRINQLRKMSSFRAAKIANILEDEFKQVWNER